MLYFDKKSGLNLVKKGIKMVKKRNPVYLIQQSEAFTVDTNEGLMTGNPGDYLAHDPISGHVWPISSEYVNIHYESY